MGSPVAPMGTLTTEVTASGWLSRAAVKPTAPPMDPATSAVSAKPTDASARVPPRPDRGCAGIAVVGWGVL